MYSLGIVIGGPTAAGKSELAFEVQKKIPSFIVNADSMQVYDKLNKLTNTPTKKEISEFDCKLYCFVKYPSLCDLGLWLKNVQETLTVNSSKIPIFVGGTGMYLDSLNGQISPLPKIPDEIIKKVLEKQKTKGNHYLYKKLQEFDPAYALKISKNDSQRIVRSLSVRIFTGRNFSTWHSIKSKKFFKKLIYIVVNNDRRKLYNKINHRCHDIFNSGCIDEIKRFLKSDESKESHPLKKAIGFKTFKNMINGLISKNEALEEFKTETRRYAKRQLTWFKNKSSEVNFLPHNKVISFILKNF